MRFFASLRMTVNINMAKTILFVEDDPFLIDIYKKKLGEAGYTVVLAENGETALKTIETTAVDLLILDIVMPKIDGWETLRQLKAHPKMQKCKVMIFSNLGGKAEVEKGLQMGADKYLIKANYTPSQVVNEVEKMLA